MKTEGRLRIVDVFVGISDPRQAENVEHDPVELLVIGIYLLTLSLTELVTNNAAAALAFRVALSTEKALGVAPMPFIMVVACGASAYFILPFGYQTHLMVYSRGRYRLAEFVRAGLQISIVYSVGVLALVPVFFPF